MKNHKFCGIPADRHKNINTNVNSQLQNFCFQCLDAVREIHAE